MPHWVISWAASSRPGHAPTGAVRVGLIATYARWKGQEVFIDAAARYKVIERSFPAQELISPYALKPRR